MLANTRATRRCPRIARTCFAAALALLFALENNFGSSKAAAKQVVSVSERQRRAAQALACICVICGFPHVSRAWKYMIIQFTSKACFLYSLLCVFCFLYYTVPHNQRACDLSNTRQNHLKHTSSHRKSLFHPPKTAPESAEFTPLII